MKTFHQKFGEAIEMIRRLHLFATTQYSQLHQAISDVELKLTDIYLDSKVNIQSRIDTYLKKD